MQSGAILQDVLARIDRRLKAVGLKESAAAVKAGLSDSAIRNMRRALKDPKSKRKNPGASIKTIDALAPVLRTTSRWLMSEEGPEDAGEALPNVLPVKLISWVSAGQLVQADAELGFEEIEYAPTVYAPGLDANGDWIALRVNGDSMNKVSPHDSVIFVNRLDRRLVPGACYVIGDGDGGATYKRYRPPNTWEPWSTNPKHEPFVLPEGRDPDIIGRVRKTVTDM